MMIFSLRRSEGVLAPFILAAWVLTLAPSSGSEPPTAPAPRLPAGVADPGAKTIFVGNDAGGVDALELASGKLKWTATGPMSPVLATKDGVIVSIVAPDFKQFTLVTLDPATGKRVRESAPVQLYNLDAPAGSEIKVEIVVQPDSLPVVMAYWRITAATATSIRSAQDRALVNLDTGRVTAAPQDEHLVAGHAAFARPFPVVVLAGRKFQVIEKADGDDRTTRSLRATDAATRNVAWEHAIRSVSGKPWAGPIRLVGNVLASADGTIGFVQRTIDAGGIDAIDLRTGKTLWQTAGRELPLYALDGALLAAEWRKDGTELVVVWLDPATGRRLRESESVPGLPPPALPGFRADASLCAADGQLRVEWWVHTRQQFGAAGLAESMSISGTFRVALDTGKISDAKSAARPAAANRVESSSVCPSEYERQELNGLRFSIQTTTEVKPDVMVFHSTLRATDAAGKLVWEHPLGSSEQSRHPPRSAPGRSRPGA